MLIYLLNLNLKYFFPYFSAVGYPVQSAPLKLADETSHSGHHQQAEDNHSTDTDAFNDEKKVRN